MDIWPRVTVGGNILTVLTSTSAPTADLPTIKMLWSLVLFTLDAKYFMIDAPNFYLGTPVKRLEDMQMPINIIPQEIIDNYNFQNIVDNEWVYIRIQKGMNGLSHSCKLARNALLKRMCNVRYFTCQFTPGLRKHVLRPVTFTLVVDKFGIKFVGNKHTN